MKYTFIDTPPLYTALCKKTSNEHLLKKLKSVSAKFKPDNFIYFDRLDDHCGEEADLGLIRSIYNVLGNRFFIHIFVIFTHACSLPPRGRNPYTQIGYENHVEHRSDMIRSVISSVIGKRISFFICPVENHQRCRRDNNGQILLPNGVPWVRNLLTLIIGCKTIKDGDSVLRAKKTKNISQEQALGMLMKLTPDLRQVIASHDVQKAPEDERGILSDKQIDQMEIGPAKKEATLRRRALLRSKIEEKRSDVNSSRMSSRWEWKLPPTFAPFEIVPHRYRYLDQYRPKQTQNDPIWYGILVRPQIAEPNGEDGESWMDGEPYFTGVSFFRKLMLRPMGKLIGGLPTHFRVSARTYKERYLQGDLEFTNGMDFLSVPTNKIKLLDSTTNFSFRRQYQNDFIYGLRNEIRTKTTLRPRDKIIIGLQFSRLCHGLFSTEGSCTYGLKVEYRAKMGAESTLTVSLGTCRPCLRSGSVVGGSRASKTSCQGVLVELKKTLSTINLYYDSNIHYITMEHLLKVTQLTSCQFSVGYQYGQIGLGMRLVSHDHPEFAATLLVPVLGSLLAHFRQQNQSSHANLF